jgi:DNA-binding GntR family transcriptional regulator
MGIEALSVTKSAVEYIRAKIITGEFQSGQKLNEIQLSSQLGISRPPIREAFRILEHEHVITSIPRKGVFISELKIEDCEDAYRFREMFECYAIDLFREKRITILPEVSSAMTLAAGLQAPPEHDADQQLKYLKIFSDFHIKMVEAGGNSRLSYFYRSIQATLWRFQFMYLSIPGAGPSSIEEHRQILEAIGIGDYDRAKEHLRNHIRHTLELLKSRMQEKTK